MAWTSNTAMVDSLIRDYLSQRGFNSTVKSFDLDLKQDKEKGFRAERILQHILNFVSTFDLDSLRSYWTHLETRIFCRFEQTHMQTVKKLEHNLYRYYVVNCVQNNKKKECLEFFEKFSQELSGLPEWKDWFALPFISHPENNKHYSTYFTKQWLDTFLVSFQNFLAITFTCMPPPQLFETLRQDKIKIEHLEKEIALLKKKLLESNRLTTPPSSKAAPPNYIKSFGVPGALSENKLEVVTQPQKKKTLPFGFSSKKNQTTSAKAKSFPIKQASLGSPRLLKKTSESNTAPIDAPSIVPSSGQDHNIATRNKKISGYQMQRRELFGGAAITTKTKSMPVKEEVLSTSPLNQTLAPSLQSNASASAAESASPNKAPAQPSPSSVFADKPDIPQESGSPVLPKQQVSEATVKTYMSHILLSKDEYHEHHSAIVQCRFNNTGGTVASSDKDGVVKVWRYEPSLTTIATVMSKSPFLSLEWCKTSEALLLLGTSSGMLRLYDTFTKQIQQDTITSTSYPRITQIACSWTGNVFATSCVSRSLSSERMSMDVDDIPLPGRVELWKLSESKAEMDRIIHENTDSDAKCISFNNQGNLLVSGYANGVMRLFDTRSYQPVASISAHSKAIYTLQFVDDYIFTLGADGKFLGWDSRDLTKPIIFPIHSSAAGPFEVSGFGGYKQVHKPSGGNLFSFEPDGQQVLTCDGSSAVIYNIDTNTTSLTKEMTLLGHRTPVLSVDWVSGKSCGHCLTGSMDGKVHVSTLLNQ